MNVAIIGCGKLGVPCGNVMHDAGHYVIGFDPHITEVSRNAKFHIHRTDSVLGWEECIRDMDIIFIAVPTAHDPAYGGETPTSTLDPKDFDYSIVRSVLKDLQRICTPSQMVVLISTVLPSTCRRLLRDIPLDCHFAYNPYLIAMGSVEEDMVSPDMIIIGNKSGGDDDFTAKTLKMFYDSINGFGTRYVVGTYDEAESIKIFYNTWISAKIALVNMIQDVSMANGNIDVDVVTDALAGSNRRITGKSYMKAGMGDAGACHPRDLIALSSLSDRLGLGYNLFGSINRAREMQALNVAKFMVGSNIFDMDYYIHGKAYKPNVGYTEGSYSLLIGHYIKELSGKDPIYVDPLTGDEVDVIDGMVLMAHHAPTTYSHSNLIGSLEQKFYAPIAPGSVVIDIWRYLTPDDVPACTLIQYGNTRRDKFIQPQV